MAMFRFYLVSDWDAGIIKGTDSEEEARNYAETDEWAVIDTETGFSLGCEGDRSDILEAEPDEDGLGEEVDDEV